MTALPSRTPAMRVRPVKRADARAFVAAHHSHHRALGAFVEGELAVVVLANPVALELEDGETWEVTRPLLRAARAALRREPPAPPRDARRALGGALAARQLHADRRAGELLPRRELAVRRRRQAA